MRHNELQFPDDRPDHEIGDALRPLLVPNGASAGSRYWEGLESRIIRRITDERSSPWIVLAGWARPAAIAAALLLAAASVLLTRQRAADAAVAYGAIAEEQFTAAAPVAASAPGYDVTVRMLLER